MLGRKEYEKVGELMVPFMAQTAGGVPTHSRQTASLPEVYVQDSSLEIAWTRIVADREIAGRRVVPFLPEGAEGFSIDYEDDWAQAERMAVELQHRYRVAYRPERRGNEG